MVWPASPKHWLRYYTGLPCPFKVFTERVKLWRMGEKRVARAFIKLIICRVHHFRHKVMQGTFLIIQKVKPFNYLLQVVLGFWT